MPIKAYNCGNIHISAMKRQIVALSVFRWDETQLELVFSCVCNRYQTYPIGALVQSESNNGKTWCTVKLM